MTEEAEKLARECEFAVLASRATYHIPYELKTAHVIAEAILPILAAQLAARDEELKRLMEALHTITGTLDEHPEGYEDECSCKLCMSYADQ